MLHASAVSETTTRRRIVVVDDDPEMLQFVAAALRPSYDVVSAPDGAAGLEAVRRVSPDLVVLDLLMPRMHGFEVCKRIKTEPALGATKVLISSSKSYAHDIKAATEAGADGYIVKPFAAEDLRAKIDELLGGAGASGVELRFWGTRGSCPAPGPLTQRYGGNTPCTELRVGEERFIIDAGTGLRELGESMLREGKPARAHILIGHTHWDHIQGLPFFTPAYRPGNSFTIRGVHGTTKSFEDVLRGQMSASYFPVEMKDMAASIAVEELNGPLKLGPATIRYHYLNHPGITVGFRFETPRGSICYISDHEPYGKLNDKGQFSAKEDADVADFADGCDLLICESQYTEDEYRLKKSWGHSTFEDVLVLAARARVKKLALFHHDPAHTDEMMDRFVAACRERAARAGIDCFGAQEGLRLTL